MGLSILNTIATNIEDAETAQNVLNLKAELSQILQSSGTTDISLNTVFDLATGLDQNPFDVFVGAACLKNPGIADQLNSLNERLKAYNISFTIRDLAMALAQEKKEDFHLYEEIPIENLSFTTQTQNILHRNRILTVRQLTNLTLNELESLRGLGQVKVNEIVTRLNESQLRLLTDQERMESGISRLHGWLTPIQLNIFSINDLLNSTFDDLLIQSRIFFNDSNPRRVVFELGSDIYRSSLNDKQILTSKFMKEWIKQFPEYKYTDDLLES